jgi:hypothetical protein
MKIALAMTLLAISTSAHGQVATAPVPKDLQSIREQMTKTVRRLALGIATATESGRGTVRKVSP